MTSTPSLVLSCEHGGARVPAAARTWFASAGARRALASHRGHDAGALAIARVLAERLAAPLVAHTVSRLVVDTNRSLEHPSLHAEFLAEAPPAVRGRLVDVHWRPHRERVRAAVEAALAAEGAVLHVGVHTFTPRLAGVDRRCDVALLYDPAREAERALARAWLTALRARRPDLRLRRNHPYRGTSDGLTTTLRRALGPRYLGIELEVSTRTARESALADELAHSLAASVRHQYGVAHPVADHQHKGPTHRP